MIDNIKKNSNKGFSLVELIIAIAIMAILATAVTVSVIRYMENARQTMDINNAKLIKDAVTAHTFPGDFQGETVNYTDPETHESETFKRGWVYVDKTEIRCSNPSLALALIDAGLVHVSNASAAKIAECEIDGTLWFPNPGDGDFIRKSNINEYVFSNKLTVKARTTWNTYQIDVYVDNSGELSLGASASNNIRTNGHEKDRETAMLFAEKLGLDGSRITPIGMQNNN